MSDDPGISPYTRTDVANLVGQINVAWGDLQFWVYTIFRYLIDDAMRAKAIFFTIRSDSTQRDITAALVDLALPHALPKELRKDARTLFSEIQRISGHRNDAIHAMWGHGFLDKTIAPIAGSSPRLQEKDAIAELQQTVNEIVEATHALKDFLDALRDAHIPLLSTDRQR